MGTNNSLYQKLLSRNIPIEQGKLQDYFADLANLLMNEYVIKKGEIKYEIIEIEFYLYSKNHPDVITYPRTISAGQWFFHQSGVDLTFESCGKQFGGILIRSIRELSTGSLILGPLNCVSKLWDSFDAFERKLSEYPYIINSKNTFSCKIRNTVRWIPVNAKKQKELGLIEARRHKLKPLAKDLNVDDAVIQLVFDSPYRFFKDSLKEAAKTYRARPAY